MVLAVIRQTATRARSIEEFENGVRERIKALSYSDDLLSQVDWANVSLADLVAHQLRPFQALQPIQVLGRKIIFDANAVLNLGMAFHELVMFELVWSEPAVAYAEMLAQEEGFGALVLGKLVPPASSGEAHWSFADGLIVCKPSAHIGTCSDLTSFLGFAL